MVHTISSKGTIMYNDRKSMYLHYKYVSTLTYIIGKGIYSSKCTLTYTIKKSTYSSNMYINHINVNTLKRCTNKKSVLT